MRCIVAMSGPHTHTNGTYLIKGDAAVAAIPNNKKKNDWFVYHSWTIFFFCIFFTYMVLLVIRFFIVGPTAKWATRHRWRTVHQSAIQHFEDFIIMLKVVC